MVMRRSRDRAPLAMAILLVAAAGGLLGLIALRSVAYELLQILMIIAGVTFFSGLSLLVSYARQPRSAPLIQITFNGNQLRDDLGRVIDAEFSEVKSVEAKPWEPTPDRLVIEDPILALAKVRIDLERELRRVGIEAKLIREDQRFDLRRTLEALERGERLPDAAYAAIRDILPICNRAIHGEEVDLATAQNVIDIANEVMTILRSVSGYPRKKVPSV